MKEEGYFKSRNRSKKRSLKECIQQSQKRALKKVNKVEPLVSKNQERIVNKVGENKKKEVNKPLHGPYFKQIIVKINKKKTWNWIKEEH